MALVTTVYSLLILVAMGFIYPSFSKNDPNLLLPYPQALHFLIPFKFSYPLALARYASTFPL